MTDPLPLTVTVPPTLSRRTPAIIALLAFLLGLAVMAALIYVYPRLVPGRSAAIGAAAQNPQLPVVVGASSDAAGTAGAGTPPAVIDLNALSMRETALAARLSELEARTMQVGGEAQAAAGYATRAEGLMVAFAARRALDRGLSLGYVEAQLRTRFGSTRPAAVATILQAAREPVTIVELREGLDGLAPELVTGARSTGWLDSLRRELGNLVVLHQAGTPSPLPSDRLARARQMLQAGKVETALAEVARMPGAGQAERWMAAARRFTGARQALDTIEATAILGPSASPADMPAAAPAS